MKNKALSARTHNEIKINNTNYIEQLKRLNVYDELLALKKIPNAKISNLIIEKTKPNDIENQMTDPKKSKL